LAGLFFWRRGGARRPMGIDIAAVRRILEKSGIPKQSQQEALAAWRGIKRGNSVPDRVLAALTATLRRSYPDAAATIAAMAADAYPEAVWPLEELAQRSLLQGDHAARLEVAARLLARAPESRVGLRIAAQSLLALGRLEDAERMVAALPTKRGWPLVLRIRLAVARGNHTDVVALTGRLRQTSPADPLGYLAACASLRALGRATDAEEVGRAGVEACASLPGMWEEAALAAELAGHPAEARRLWSEMGERFPRSEAPCLGLIALSQNQQDHEQTERLVADALARFPRSSRVRSLAARQAARAGRWRQAERHWQAAIDRAPNDPALQVAAAVSMIGPGARRRERLADSVARLRAVHERFPDYAPGTPAHLADLIEGGKLDEAEQMHAAWPGALPPDPALPAADARGPDAGAQAA